MPQRTSSRDFRLPLLMRGALVAALASGAAAADVGTAFTYQGQLKQNGVPLNGADQANLRFTLYSDPMAGALVAGPIVVSNVDFKDGLFTIANLDFGPGAFDGQGRWMVIEVSRPPGSAYVPLNPPQAIQPAPYALALPGLYSQQTGTVPNLIGGYAGNAMTVGVIGGTIAGGGQAGTTNRVSDNFSTIGGGENNQAGNANGNVTDRRHATVAGGSGNTASGLRSFVGGGEANTASGGDAVVAGGSGNSAAIQFATVPGGRFNTAGGEYSFAAGRRAKVRTSTQVGGSDTDGDQGTFVWADSNLDADFLSTGPNQFLIRAAGGMGISLDGTPVLPNAGEAISAAGVVESTVGGFKFPDGSTQATAAGSSLWTASGSSIYNNNAGNVGVGTTNPQRRLHVAGNSNVLALEGSDHAFVEYYPDTFAGGRKAWMGFGGAASNDFELRNQIGGGHIILNTTGSGNVGIGTNAPAHRLAVVGNLFALGADGYDAPGDRAYLYLGDTAASIAAEAGGGLRLSAFQAQDALSVQQVTGNVGIGTANPAYRLDLQDADDARVRLARNGQNAVVLGGNSFGNSVSVYDASGNVSILLHGNTGQATVKVLEITGADVAEKFPVSDRPEPGMVVEIDPENPGKLRVSATAYNRRVAGVVSGAGGLSAGAILGNLPGNEDAPPIALSGRVWVNCDANSGTIQPGDLLTTSDTPGHAMKVEDHAKAQGAIIGKAMTRLAGGDRGLVLVLVNLQ